MRKEIPSAFEDCVAVVGASNPSTAAPIPPRSEETGLLGESR